MPKTLWFFAEGEWHKISVATGTGAGSGIFYTFYNVGDWLNILTGNPGDDTHGLVLEDISDLGINIKENGNGQLNIQNTGGDGGIKIENDGGYLNNDSEAGIYLEDNGKGGITMLATGEGTGFAACQSTFIVENYGGQMYLVNTDEGIILRSTGQFSADRLLDFTSLTGDSTPPGMIIAATDGIVLSRDGPVGPEEETGSLENVFLYTFTGSPSCLLLPSTFIQTTDPGIDNAIWNDGGTVVFSGFTAGGGTTPALSAVLLVGNDAGANAITNLADPTLAQDAATKAYVDSVTPPAPDLTSVLTVDNDAGGLGISNLLDPVSAQDAATKNYVDTAIIDGGGP